VIVAGGDGMAVVFLTVALLVFGLGAWAMWRTGA
jgi:hypothetical protein